MSFYRNYSTYQARQPVHRPDGGFWKPLLLGSLFTGAAIFLFPGQERSQLERLCPAHGQEGLFYAAGKSFSYSEPSVVEVQATTNLLASPKMGKQEVTGVVSQGEQLTAIEFLYEPLACDVWLKIALPNGETGWILLRNVSTSILLPHIDANAYSVL
jgi:hypothetical protein